MSRPDGRKPHELRKISITPDFTVHAEGSVLVAFGDTQVICTATVEDKLPPFLKDKGDQGWVTAEYAMLPRSTHTRSGRNPGGRGQEIQRLIGRALRMAVDAKKLGPRTVTIDCDVIQADGGTRTAAITGGWVALALAIRRSSGQGGAKEGALARQVAALSAGIIDGEVRVDLPYVEDSQADVDGNFVMTGDGRFAEVQVTAEKVAFDAAAHAAMLGLVAESMTTLFAAQRDALARAR